ncbi:MAG TPA: alpha/beta hydrolase [Sphingomicrobium sp.]|jgi:acetyl esterase
MDPQVRLIAEALAEADLPPLETLDVERARAQVAMMSQGTPPGPPVETVRDLSLDIGEAPIAGRLYRPASPPVGLIVYFHGGGWVLGDLDSADALARELTVRSGCALLSVNYRHAPEHRFPAAVLDAEAAIVWAAANMAELVGGSLPLVVAGDSAGGNLAIAAARAAAASGIDLAFQLLLYPVTDAACATESYREFSTGPFLTSRIMAWFWDHYAPDAAQRSDDRASPLRATDLASLPPTLILIADLDPLRDEGEAFGKALAEAGVDVEVQRVAGQVHGFAAMASMVGAADGALDHAGRSIRQHCERAGAVG